MDVAFSWRVYYISFCISNILLKLIIFLLKSLKIDTSHEKSNILQDDENTTREEWNCYFVYLIYLCELSRKVKQLLKQGKED